MQSVNILIQALTNYQGTFVVISHDRHFVATIANKIWYLEGRQIKEYPGNYDEFVYWLETNGRSIQDLDTPPKKDKKEKAETVVSQSVLDKEAKQKQLKNIQKQINTTEQKIADLEKQIKNCEAELAKPSVYGDVTKLAEITEKYNKAKKYLAAENIAWEKLVEEADALK
jgi:ATP-binding cassette subfamily F protein 3